MSYAPTDSLFLGLKKKAENSCGTMMYFKTSDLCFTINVMQTISHPCVIGVCLTYLLHGAESFLRS